MTEVPDLSGEGLMSEIDDWAAPSTFQASAPQTWEETTSQPGRLVSRVDHPVEVLTSQGSIRLSPRAVVRTEGKNLIHPLPKGAMFVPDKGDRSFY